MTLVEARRGGASNCSYRASRWGKDSHRAAESEAGAEGDYINCPLTRDEYVAFVEAVRAGRKVAPHDFEEPKYFESCLPIDQLELWISSVAEEGEVAQHLLSVAAK